MRVLSSTTESSLQKLLIRTFVPESIQAQGGKGFERSLVTQMIESDTAVMDHGDTIEILYFRDHCASVLLLESNCYISVRYIDPADGSYDAR